MSRVTCVVQMCFEGVQCRGNDRSIQVCCYVVCSLIEDCAILPSHNSIYFYCAIQYQTLFFMSSIYCVSLQYRHFIVNNIVQYGILGNNIDRVGSP